MLELFVNNKKMHLDDDIEIDLILENPLLLQDRIPSPYSLSFELPATPDILKEFGNPNRFNSKGNWKLLPMYLKYNSIVFLSGTIKMNFFKKKIKANVIGANLPLLLRETMNSIDLERYDFGSGTYSSPQFSEKWVQDYINLIVKQVKIGEDWTACPVRVAKEKYLGRPGIFDSVSWLNMYMNNFNPVDGTYQNEFTSGAKYHAPIFPQFYIHKLIDYFFEGFLSENPFKGELSDLVMISTFHENFKKNRIETTRGILLENGSSYKSGENNYIELESYLPEYPFNEFLKEVLKIFCMTLFKKPNGSYKIVKNSEVITTSEIVDWTHKVRGKIERTNIKGQTYSCGYSDSKKENTGKYDNEPENVENVKELLGKKPSTPTLYRINTTGEVYLKEKAKWTGPHDNNEEYWKYTRKYDGLGSSKQKGDYDMKSNVKALSMTIDTYQQPNGERKPWHVPCFEDDRFDNTLVPSLSFFQGWINLTSGEINLKPSDLSNHYPYLSPFNVDLKNNKVGRISLDWESENNINRTFHEPFANWIERDKEKIKVPLDLNPLDLKNIDWTKKILLYARKFILNKVELKVKKRSISLSNSELIEC